MFNRKAPEEQKRLRYLPAFAVIIAAALFCYLPSFQNGLSRDDSFVFRYLSAQPPGQSAFVGTAKIMEAMESSGLSGLFRPITHASFIGDAKLWGLWAGGFHATNVFLHIVAGMLCLVVLYRVCANMLMSLIAALLFTVHPVQFEAVGLIHNRSDIFCLIFLLIMFLCFHAYTKHRRRMFLALSFLSYFLGLLSKESAVFFPALLFIYGYYVCEERLPKRDWRYGMKLSGAYVCVFLLYLLTRTIFSGGLHFERFWGSYNFITEPGIVHKLSAALNIFGHYIVILFSASGPFSFCADYFIPAADHFLKPEGFLGLAVIGAVVYAILRYGRSSPLLIFGAAWAFVAYLPVANLIAIGNMFSEHFLYIPSVGFFAVLSAAFLPLWDKKPASCICLNRNRFAFLFIVLVFVSWSRSAFLRNAHIKNDRSLWFYTAQNPLASPRAHAVLGQYYIQSGQWGLAESELKKTLAKNPAYHPAYLMLGHIYRQEKLFEKAGWYFLKGAEYAQKNNDPESFRDALAELKSLGFE